MCENDLGAVCSCTVGFIYSQHSLPSLLLVLVFWSVAVFFFVCLYALGTVHYRWVGTHLTQLWFPPLLQFIHCTVPSFWLNMLCSWYLSKFWQPWVKLSKKSIKWWTTHSCTWINNSSSEIWCLSRIYGFEILQGWEKITEGQHSSVSGLYSW